MFVRCVEAAKYRHKTQAERRKTIRRASRNHRRQKGSAKIRGNVKITGIPI